MKKFLAFFLVGFLGLVNASEAPNEVVLVKAKQSEGNISKTEVNKTSEAVSSHLVLIKVEKAKKLFDEGKSLFVDARGFKLYQKGTIMGAINVPVKKYPAIKSLMPIDKNATIVTFCNGFACEKADELTELLIKDNYTNILVYKGGYPEWKEKKYPLMGLVKECKETPKGEYKPENPATTINGATVHVGEDDGMIDQFWFAKVVLTDLPKNIQLVDVRKAKQYEEGHIKGAINVPFADEKLDVSKLPKDKLVVFYCNTGMMSTDSFMFLSDEQNKNVLYFDANVKCKKNECTVEPNELL